MASNATTLEAWPDADGVAHAPTAGSAGEPEDTAPTASTGQGRAARRRQLARWKKHRRRAVVATAVALVGGGLTVAALPSTRPSNSHTQAGPPPEPVTAATPGTSATDSSSEQPDTRVSRDPSTRPPMTAGRQKNKSATVAVPSTATKTSQESGSLAGAAQATATTRSVKPQVTPDSVPDAASDAGQGTGVGTGTDAGTDADAPTTAPAPAPAPETTAPAPAQRPGVVGTIVGGLLPTTSADEPTSPTQVCLVGLCVR